MLNKRILLAFVVVFLTLLIGCLPAPPNQAPVITSTPVTDAEVGVPYTYNVNATDPDVGDTLTYSLVSKPTNMSINSTTGLINWIPAIPGTFNVVVKVSDGDLDITQSFNITVIEEEEPSPTPTPPPVNHAPVINSSPITDAIMGVAYIYDVEATDPDGDTLTYSAVKPFGMGINSANGVIDWIPTAEGTFAVEVKVSDGALSDTQSFKITVSAVELTEVKVFPETMALLKGDFKAFIVTAHYNDGTSADVTSDCIYQSSNDLIAIVVIGEVTAVNFGTANIAVAYTHPDGIFFNAIVVKVIGPVHNVTQDLYYMFIQSAIDDTLAEPGDTILVAPGTYNECVNISYPLTLQGEDRETTEIKFGYGTYPTEPPLTILADGVTVSGFTIHSGPYIEKALGAPGGYAHTIIVDGDSALFTDLNVIKDPLLTYNNLPRIGGSAFWLGPCINGFTFTDSIVESGWNGIYAREDGSDITVRNVEFTYPGDYGILLKLITGATIEENTFICTGHSIVVPPPNEKVSDGIIISRGSNGIEIKENQFIGSQPLVVSHIGILLQDFKTGPVGVSILGNDISDFDTGIKVEENVATSGISIHYNNIFSNVTGVNNATAAGLDAIDNWWGDASGPYHPITNPLALGDEVSDDVVYIPWSIELN